MKQRRKCETPVPVSDLIRGYLKSRGLESALQEFDVVQKWAEVVGPAMAEHVVPDVIENKTLFLKVSNAAWRTQVAFMKQEIVRKVNIYAGKALIKGVFLR